MNTIVPMSRLFGVALLFLLYAFAPCGSGQIQISCFIRAVAGVLYGTITAAVRLIERNKIKTSG